MHLILPAFETVVLSGKQQLPLAITTKMARDLKASCCHSHDYELDQVTGLRGNSRALQVTHWKYCN